MTDVWHVSNAEKAGRTEKRQAFYSDEEETITGEEALWKEEKGLKERKKAFEEKERSSSDDRRGSRFKKSWKGPREEDSVKETWEEEAMCSVHTEEIDAPHTLLPCQNMAPTLSTMQLICQQFSRRCVVHEEDLKLET